MQDKLQKDIDRIFNHDAISIGKAFPIIYRRIKELGGRVHTLKLIERLKKFEAKVGHIKKEHINKIVKIIMDENSQKGRT